MYQSEELEALRELIEMIRDVDDNVVFETNNRGDTIVEEGATDLVSLLQHLQYMQPILEDLLDYHESL